MNSTPPPWFVEVCSGGIIEIQEEDGSLIASVHDNGHAVDNAALISAAPDCLAVCQFLDEYQRNFEEKAWEPDCMPGNQLYSDRAMVIVRAARAAIAKAKGES